MEKHPVAHVSVSYSYFEQHLCLCYSVRTRPERNDLFALDWHKTMFGPHITAYQSGCNQNMMRKGSSSCKIRTYFINLTDFEMGLACCKEEEVDEDEQVSIEEDEPTSW